MNITTWIGNTQMPQNETGTQRNTKVQGKQDDLTFGALLRDIEKKCPYSYMARDGIIEYNGVVFVCDYKNNSITLGDMTDPKKVLNISLPSGGNLKVNVENFGDISKAASMFSPEDLNAILRAIHYFNENDRVERAVAAAEKNEKVHLTFVEVMTSPERTLVLQEAIKNFEAAHQSSLNAMHNSCSHT